MEIESSNNSFFIKNEEDYRRRKNYLSYTYFEGKSLIIGNFLLQNLRDIMESKNDFINDREAVKEQLLKLEKIGKGTVDKFLKELEKANKESLLTLSDKYAIESIIPKGHVKFKKYCEENSLKVFLDIDEKVLDDFEKERGKSKAVLDIIQKYNELKGIIVQEERDSYAAQKKRDSESRPIKIKGELLEVSCKNLIAREMKYGDFNNRTLKEIEEETDLETLDIEKVIEWNEKFIPLNKILEKSLDINAQKLLHDRYIRGMTLEEIGKIKKVSRERIRQLEVKALKKIESRINYINDFFRIVLSRKKNYKPEELNKYLDEKYYFFIELMKITKKKKDGMVSLLDLNLKYYSDLNLFSYKELDEFKISTELKDVIHIRYDFEEIKKVLINNHVIIESPSELENILEGYGYRKYKNYYSLSNLNKSDYINLIFKDLYRGEGVKIDLDKFEEMNSYSLEELGENLETKMDSIRSLEGAIERAKDVIQYKDKTYCHIDYLEGVLGDTTIVDDMNIYIQDKKQKWEQGKSSKPYVNAEELEEAFKESLEKEKLKNYDKETPYFLIKYFYGDEYNFGGNNRHIEFSDIKLDREGLILNILKNEENRVADKRMVAEKLEWPLNRVEDTIAKYESLVSLNKKVTSVESLNLSVEFTELLREVISKELGHKEYFSTFKVFNQLKHNHLAKEVFDSLFITNEESLNSLIRGIFPKTYATLSRGKILTIDMESSFSIEDIFRREFLDKGIFTREEMQKFFIGYGYREASLFNLPRNLEVSGEIKKIDIDEYILNENFNISNEITGRVFDFIEENIGKSEYLSLSHLNSEIKSLGETGLEGISRFNEHLVKTIVLNHSEEFKDLMRFNSDYRYDRVIIIKESSTIDTFEELLYRVIKNEYNGNSWHESVIFDFLAGDKGLLYSNVDSNQVLPYDVKREEYKKITVNSFGYVSLDEKK